MSGVQVQSRSTVSSVYSVYQPTDIVIDPVVIPNAGGGNNLAVPPSITSSRGYQNQNGRNIVSPFVINGASNNAASNQNLLMSSANYFPE